ncbi:MAG: hypothetical protein E7208_10220 [Clostridium butyricum]|nr:hypothetical protein [Clostridium butyricum]
MKVYLKDVIEAIEFENELLNHFYNKKTGVIIYKEDFSTSTYSAEDINKIDEFEEWERDLICNLQDLKENPDDYIQLPQKDELYELKMMMDFCNSFSDISLENNLDINSSDENTKLHQIKKIIQDKELINEWYDYREDTEREIAIKWCDDNNIEYIE